MMPLETARAGGRMARDGFVLRRSDGLARVSALAWAVFFLSVSNVRVTSDVHIFFGKAVGDVVIIHRRHRNSVALLNRGRLAISTDPLFLFRTRADRK